VPAAEFPFNDGRRPAFTPLYVCVGCGSGHFRHIPREDVSLPWHKAVLERNTAWSEVLAGKLAVHARVSSVIDIGCGIGTWLHFMARRGASVLGFDTAGECVLYGRERFGLTLLNERFAHDHPVARDARADLLTCIMVMEHLSQPRMLAREMAIYCRETGAKAFVSVPFFNDKAFLEFDSESPRYNVFNDVGAHVTYFSDEGLTSMFRDFGMRVSARIEGLAWRGFLFQPEA
jgi:SAM-dependent methyltransferase